jgi:hypothetical protein
MKDIVVEVQDGVVVGLYCDIVDARFVIVDWDTIKSGDVNDGVGVERHEKLKSIPALVRKHYRRAISV